MIVHNHGTEDGPGLSCPEIRLPDGSLQGACMSKKWKMVQGNIPVFIDGDLGKLIGKLTFLINEDAPMATMTIVVDRKSDAQALMTYLEDQAEVLGVSFVSIPVQPTT